LRVFSFKAALSDTGRDAVLDEIMAIREGNETLRSQFIQRHTKYILSIASKVKGSYVQIENDEEYSIALFAFNRAIDFYEPTKGATFLSYAGCLIRNAIIDLYRKNSTIREVAVSQLKDEDGGYRDGSSRDSGRPVTIESLNPGNVEQVIRMQEDQFNLQQEITIYKALLSEYSIDFNVLVTASPKHVKTRRNMIRLAKTLSEDPFSRAFIKKRRLLPMNDLEKWAGVSRRTLGRHRKYILAVFILLDSDLDYLKDYIKDVLQEGEEA
jgi:RNA polymerase sigma factor